MSKRDCANVISQNRCYVRKAGPRSEEPQNTEEWRTLLNRCVRAQREDMLDAIRAIVTGRVDATAAAPNEEQVLTEFTVLARQGWNELVSVLPDRHPSRFPYGFYELSFALSGAEPCQSLTDLNERLRAVQQVRLSGWPPFLIMATEGWSPYPEDDSVQAWVGRPVRPDAAEREPSHCDFWRASRQGQLYMIRGYPEDGIENREPGKFLDVITPVVRVGEAILAATRLAQTFPGVERVLIHCRFTGLAGRVLTSISGRRLMFDESVSRSEEICLVGAATLDQLQDNLPEVLLPLLSPLYERFDFFRLPAQLVGEECQRLQQNRF